MITEFYSPKHIIFGDGAFQQFVQHAKKLSMNYMLLFYNPTIFSIEQKDKLKQQLLDANLRAYFFEMPSGEPTLTLMRIAVKAFTENGCDSVAAIGGGSAIDLAKAVSAIAVTPTLKFEQLSNLPTVERVPFIAVPTVGSLGSEVSRVAVLTDEQQRVKYKSSHEDLIPDVAILDPLLTVNMSEESICYGALAAITHAIEAYVSTKATTLTDVYAMKAIETLVPALRDVQQFGFNAERRAELLLGSYYSGIAFSNSTSNLAFAIGRVLSAYYQLPQGQLAAMIHPFVIEQSMQSTKVRYMKIAQVMQLPTPETIPSFLLQLNEELHIWHESAIFASQTFIEDIEELAQKVMQSSGIKTNRYVPTIEHIEQLLLQLHQFVKQRQRLQQL